jgi:hypothetical protein
MNEAQVALFISVFNTLIMGLVAIIRQCQQSNCKKVTIKCCCCGLTACMEPPKQNIIITTVPPEPSSQPPLQIEMVENNI